MSWGVFAATLCGLLMFDLGYALGTREDDLTVWVLVLIAQGAFAVAVLVLSRLGGEE